MMSALHVVRSGTGPIVVLIHGSAADHSTWSIQLASSSLREHRSLWAYDRRGTGATAPELDAASAPSVEQHADDVAALAGTAGGKVWLAGSSFGAVIALETMRRYPELVHGAVLIEPPLAPSDATNDVAGFLEAFDREVATAGGEAAAELFLRTVLGEAAFARVPRPFRQRSMRLWRQIRADSEALSRYQPRYAELGAVALPTLLLGGERSAPTFRPTLDALARALPDAHLEIVKGAGHMLHAEGYRRFAELLLDFTSRR